ncbi:MAG: ATP-binding domain-containing protein [Nocardioidaceae bacterium]
MTWAYAVGDLVSGKDNLAPNVQTNDFKDVQPVDEQMDAHERHRLLYVAATRARDHLVVSLHRTTGNASTNAKLLADSGAATAAGAQPFTARKFGASRVTSPAAVTAPPDWAQWLHQLRAAQDTTRWSAPSAPQDSKAPSRQLPLTSTKAAHRRGQPRAPVTSSCRPGPRAAHVGASDGFGE